jgi:hypothetical protein
MGDPPNGPGRSEWLNLRGIFAWFADPWQPAPVGPGIGVAAAAAVGLGAADDDVTTRRSARRASMIDAVFSFFALPWVPWALSALLILGAVGIWLDFRRRLEPVLLGLDDALQVVEEAGNAASFTDRFPSINQRLAANPVIGESWRAFVKTLVPVPGQDDVLGTTRRPHEDLNENILTRAGVNLRFYTAVPNYLVGLGLLFTFLGLVAALYFASAGVTAPNIQAAQGALRDLLAAATFKFVTSIAGLGASIAYSSREKTQLYRVGHRLAGLCTALEQRLVPVTPEYLGIVQLAEMKGQSTLLRRLGRHLHITVPETIEERLAGELLDAIAPLREGFARAAERIGQLDESVAARLVSGARPAQAAPAGLLDQAALGQMLDELRLVRAAIEALPGLQARAATDGAREPSAAPRDQTLPKLIELFETSSVCIGALDTGLEASLDQIQDRFRQFRAALLTGGHGAIERTSGQLEASIDRLADARADLGELGRAFREVAASSRTMLAACEARGGQGDAELSAGLEQLGQHVMRFNERVRSFVRRVDEELARSSKLLSGAAHGSGEDGS